MMVGILGIPTGGIHALPDRLGIYEWVLHVVAHSQELSSVFPAVYYGGARLVE